MSDNNFYCDSHFMPVTDIFCPPQTFFPLAQSKCVCDNGVSVVSVKKCLSQSFFPLTIEIDQLQRPFRCISQKMSVTDIFSVVSDKIRLSQRLVIIIVNLLTAVD